MPLGRPLGSPTRDTHIAGLRRDVNMLKNRQGAAESGSRIVYGTTFSDGDAEDAGSGDWTGDATGNFVVITIDPPFNTMPAVAVTAAETSWDGSTSIGIDPTIFGEAPVPGDPHTAADYAGKTIARKFTLSDSDFSDGNYFNALYVAYRLPSGQTVNLRGRIYADNSGSPGEAVTDLASGRGFGLTGTDTQGILLFPTIQRLPDGDYWIAVSFETSSTINPIYAASSGGTSAVRTGLGMPDPFPAFTPDTNEWRLYAQQPALISTPPAPPAVPKALIALDQIGVYFVNGDGTLNDDSTDFSFIAIGT